MEKIKVQLDFNITRKIHSLYNSLFQNPPEGIEYTKSEFSLINNNSYSILGKTRKAIIKVFPFVKNLDHSIIHLLRKESGADLIHFTFHLGDTNKRCVADYEHAYNFVDISDKNNQKNKEKAIKRLSKDNLKYLMPINYEALKSFELFFGDRVKKPQEVVYPTTIIPPEFRKKVKKENIVLFMGTSNISGDLPFFIKGGIETLKAFDILAKKYPSYKFMVFSGIPEFLQKEYPSNLILMKPQPQKDLWGIMNRSKIFVQMNYHAPTMAYIEAMFFKLPIITYDQWANNEYVDNSNGILIEPEEINHIDENNIPVYNDEVVQRIKDNSDKNSEKIIKAVSDLIEDEKRAKLMGERGYTRVIYGKFCIKNRNKKLKKIYEEALK